MLTCSDTASLADTLVEASVELLTDWLTLVLAASEFCVLTLLDRLSLVSSLVLFSSLMDVDC